MILELGINATENSFQLGWRPSVGPLVTLSKIQGHQPEMSDSVKLFLRDAKKLRFQIDFFWKSIDYRFLYQNFIDLCQIVCLLHGFEVTAKFPPQNWFPIEICLQSIFDLLSFLNDLSYRCEIGLVWKIIWCSFRNLTKQQIIL